MPRSRALRPQGPRRAPRGGVERRIADRAPIVPLLNPRSVVVTSPRAGNVQVHPVTGVLLLEHVWVR